MQEETLRGFTQASDSDQVGISGECPGCAVQNTSAQTVAASAGRGGGSGDWPSEGWRCVRSRSPRTGE